MKLFKFAFAVTLILCSSYGFAADVTTAADLATALTESPAGTIVTLGADIDCSGWTTVDSFSGTLDGKGYKIENLDAPLFGTITGDIAISNLVVKDASVTATAETCGILLKSVTAANLAVENVTFTGSTLRISINKGNMGFVVGLFSVTGTASFSDCAVSIDLFSHGCWSSSPSSSPKRSKILTIRSEPKSRIRLSSSET